MIDEIFDPLRPGSKLWLVQKYPPYYLEAPVVNIRQMLASFEIITIYVSIAEGGISFPSKCLSQLTTSVHLIFSISAHSKQENREMQG